MNFDKESFSKILIKIKDSYGSINQMAEKTDVTAAYISKLIRLMYDSSPSPEILRKIANNSNGIITYEDLMQVCGYKEETLESIVYDIYKQYKNLFQILSNQDKMDMSDAEYYLGIFQDYISNLIKSIEENQSSKLFLVDYFRKEFFIEEYCSLIIFLFLYESFLKCMEKENYIILKNYNYTNWFDKNTFYKKIVDSNYLEHLELLSCQSSIIKLNTSISHFDILHYINNFASCLSLAYFSDFDNNSLTELFRERVNSKKTVNVQASDEKLSFSPNNKFYSCPVYRTDFCWST